jgi:hypothetical protein
VIVALLSLVAGSDSKPSRVDHRSQSDASSDVAGEILRPFGLEAKGDRRFSASTVA